MIASLYDRLVDIDENGKIVPMLAWSYDISDDRKTYAFELQKGVEFHDGTPLNAEAVKFNLERYQKEDSVRSTEIEPVESVEAVDEYTVRVTLSEPFAPFLVQTTLAMGYAIIAEATLSYLGLGAEPGEPSWGSMLYQAQSYLTSAWWMAFFPGMAIFFAVLGFNLLGDGVREALDPRTYD